MRWFPIGRPRIAQPEGSSYTEWKDALSREGGSQCVYCAISETAWGGLRNFHVEHYRPKSKFPQFEHSIENLFYACSVCNVFKSDDWPAEPDETLETPSYPDPSVVDYNSVFTVDAAWRVAGRFPAAEYLVHRLYLNRPQLVLERRSADLFRRLDTLREEFKSLLPAAVSSKHHLNVELGALVTALSDVMDVESALRTARPYSVTDLQRPRA